MEYSILQGIFVVFFFFFFFMVNQIILQMIHKAILIKLEKKMLQITPIQFGKTT